MKHSMRRLTGEDLRKLAQDDNAIVMEEAPKRTFDPWPMNKVEDCAHRMRELTLRLRGDEAAVGAEVAKDAVLVDFRDHHPTLYAKLTSVDFCQDPRTMKTLLQIFQIKKQQEAGTIDYGKAKEMASVASLKVALPEHHPAQGSIEDQD